MKLTVQLYLLLWKNAVLLKRRWKSYLIEIAIPLVLCAGLVCVRFLKKNEHYTESIPYPEISGGDSGILLNGLGRELQPLCISDNNTRFIDPDYTGDYTISERFSRCNSLNEDATSFKSVQPLFYTPSVPLTDSLMKLVSNMSHFVPLTNEAVFMNATGLASENDMVEENIKSKRKPDDTMYVVFDNIDQSTRTMPKVIKYTVRFGGTSYHLKDGPWYLESDKKRYNPKAAYDHLDAEIPMPTWKTKDDNDIIDISGSGKSYLQLNMIMAKASYKQWIREQQEDKETLRLVHLTTLKFNYPPYSKDTIIPLIKDLVTYLVVISFFLTALNNVKALLCEKEAGLKEIMRMMGMQDTAITLSWVITQQLCLVPALIIYPSFLKLPLAGAPIFVLTDVSVLIMLFLLYGLSVISFCLMVSSIMSKSINAPIVVGGIFSGFIAPFYLISNVGGFSRAVQVVSNLFMNTAMCQAIKTALAWELEHQGAQWSNLGDYPNDGAVVTMADHIAMMALDSLLYLIIYWYVDKIRPGDFGVGQPFYFPCMASYWNGETAQPDTVSPTAQDPKYFEADPQGLTAGIQIMNLKKMYGPKLVVDGVTANMYEGQIFVLLGHNGAGKTTTMQMLTGFITPSSGTALVNGFDIGTNMTGVRSSLGFCPQHDILWNHMTVNEHLLFFSMLKGSEAPQDEAAKTVQEVGLGEKSDVMAGQLSGGMRRKLCVGMALVGDSKVVFLDEPTAGMDVGARRQTWDLLQAARAGRTLVMCTHYMDEADVLGDRIGIMATGKFSCVGSSLFLKKLYGVGYHMVVVTDGSGLVGNLTDYVQVRVPGAVHTETVNLEVTYLLPDAALPTFARLFRDLDKDKDRLGVTSYGINATTMEEVFLKAGAHPAEHKGEGGQTEVKVDAMPDVITMDTGASLEMGRLGALMTKYAILAWNGKFCLLIKLLIPVIVTLFVVNLPDFLKAEEFNKVEMTLNLFKDSKVPYACTPTSQAATRFCKSYVKQFTSMPGISGTTTLDLATSDKVRTYAAAQKVAEDSFEAYKKVVIGMIAGVTVETKPQGTLTTLNLTAVHNQAAWHSLPISMIHAYNAMLGFLTRDKLYIQPSLSPMPIKPGGITAKAILGAILNPVATMVPLAYALQIAMLLSYASRDRMTGARHLQTLSGVSPLVYWLSNFLCDMGLVLAALLLQLVALFAMDYQELISGFSIGPYLVMCICFPMAFLPFIYILSMYIDRPATGIQYIFAASNITTMILPLMIWIVKMITKPVGDTLDLVANIIFLEYNMVKGIINIITNYDNKIFCETSPNAPICSESCSKIFADLQKRFDICKNSNDGFGIEGNGIGIPLCMLMVKCILGSVLLILIDKGVFTSGAAAQDVAAGQEEDDDVAAAAARVLGNQEGVVKEDAVVMVNCTKKYGSFTGVDAVSIGIAEGTCFGLLGQNGAGKTTTFKMVSGDVPITAGDAFVKGYSVRRQLAEVQCRLGYCPQHGGLIGELTARQTVTLFARLKGVPALQVTGVTSSLLDELTLTPHADKQSGRYSGGNKRKLSIAVALVGNPPVVMLDEPTAGVDVAARREIWNTLAKVRARGNTLILTTHSMEECDALCTSLVIMVNGKFRCLGSPQHLKNKFGQGFTLTVQLDTNENGEACDSRFIIAFILAEFPGAAVFDEHAGYIHFTVPEYAASLADLFEVMESVKMNTAESKKKSKMFGSKSQINLNANHTSPNTPRANPSPMYSKNPSRQDNNQSASNAGAPGGMRERATLDVVNSLRVVDYAVAQTTLEQVFLSFAKYQKTAPPPPPAPSKCGCC